MPPGGGRAGPNSRATDSPSSCHPTRSAADLGAADLGRSRSCDSRRPPETTQAHPRPPRLARDHRNTRAQGSPCTRARSRLVCTDPRDGSPRSVHPPAWRCGMTRTERTNGRPANFAATEAPVRLEAAFRGRDGDPNALGSHRPHKLSSRRALPAPLGGRRSGGCRRGRRSGRGRRSRRRR